MCYFDFIDVTSNLVDSIIKGVFSSKLKLGPSPNDSRCLILLRLANGTRLHLLPNTNDNASSRSDLTAHAVHIVIPTDNIAAAMGLQNSSNLNGFAVNVVSNCQPREQDNASLGVQTTQPRLKLKLFLKLAQAGVDALVQLVRTDQSVALRVFHTR